MSAAELRYLTEVDGVDHLALVAVLEDDRDAVRLEQRVQHDGVRQVVAELPGCGAATLAA